MNTQALSVLRQHKAAVFQEDRNIKTTNRPFFLCPIYPSIVHAPGSPYISLTVVPLSVAGLMKEANEHVAALVPPHIVLFPPDCLWPRVTSCGCRTEEHRPIQQTSFYFHHTHTHTHAYIFR